MRRVTAYLFLITASVVSLAGCAIAVNVPSAGPGGDPMAVREKLPLRAAVVITQAQLDAQHDVPFSQQGDRFVLSGLAKNLEEALSASVAPLFEAVAVERTSPLPGKYDVVLTPRISDPTAQFFPGFANKRLTVAVSGTLQVLDRSGRLLSSLHAEDQLTVDLGAFPMPPAMGEQAGVATSRVIRQIVQRWGEQLSASRDLELYAKGEAAQQAGGATRPASDIAISFSYPVEGSRLPDERVRVVGLVTTPRGIGRLELAVNGRPVPVSRDVRVQSTDVKSHPFSAEIPLNPGQNLITLTAIDAAGNAAQAVRTVFREIPQPTSAAAPSAKLGSGERWAVVIGIDQYRDPSISSLRYATADAEAIFRFLTTRGGVKPGNARLLLNKDATQRGIREALGSFLRQRAVRE
ncbi:MAG: caspase family protein, partial [Dehalococcoidia bacterium]|nr:caspase family protein [Dehalococcoidia bacterium]